MAEEKNDLYPCEVCKKKFQKYALFPLEMIRRSFCQFIKKDHPDLPEKGYICSDDLDHYKSMSAHVALEAKLGKLTQLEHEVLQSFKKNEVIAENINEEFDETLTFGERVADHVAEFGGSWTFIISFFVFLIIWIIANSIVLMLKPFDPYPFILLNLILSCLAAMQAPIIMMSQNRQEDKDRLRAEHDYQVNLKAELEIRHLSARLDGFIKSQWYHFIEFERRQAELVKHILHEVEKSGKKDE